MGYRHYFMLANKRDCEAVKNLTYDQLIEFCKVQYPAAVEDDGSGLFLNFHEILGQQRAFEFGKLYYEDTADRIYSKGAPLFANRKTQEEFFDYNPYVMGAGAVLEAIEIYRQKIISYYENLLVDGAIQIGPFGIEIKREDIKSIDKVCDHIKDMLRWWKGSAINTDRNNPCITTSWLYEHQIFELVRMYKEIDWDEKCLLFYGW